MEHVVFKEQLDSWENGAPLSVLFLATKHNIRHKTELVLRLIEIDLDFRRRDDPTVSLEPYLRAFPDLANTLRDHWVGTSTMLMPTAADASHAPPSRNGSNQLENQPSRERRTFSSDFVPPPVPDYELFKPIGKGSFGTVWLARDTRVRRPCAIKILDRNADADLQGVAACRDIKKGHPHIISIWHIGTTLDGCTFYVMPLADPLLTDGTAGPPLKAVALDVQEEIVNYRPLTLASLLSFRQSIPPHEVVTLLRHLLSGLAELHSQPICHYDIKPSNIVQIDGQWQLIDVGLATHTAESRRGNTPAYCPPTPSSGPSSDLYATGMTAYVALTGGRPDRYRRLQPQPWSLRFGPADRLYRHLIPILNSACAQNPAERYTNTESMLKAVDRISHGSRLMTRRAACAAILATAFGTLATTSSRPTTEPEPARFDPNELIGIEPNEPTGIDPNECTDAVMGRIEVESQLRDGNWNAAEEASSRLVEITTNFCNHGLDQEWRMMSIALNFVARNAASFPMMESAWFPNGVENLISMPANDAICESDQAVKLRRMLLQYHQDKKAAQSDTLWGLKFLLADAYITSSRVRCAVGRDVLESDPVLSKSHFLEARDLAQAAIDLYDGAQADQPPISFFWAEYHRESANIELNPQHELHFHTVQDAFKSDITRTIQRLRALLKLKQAYRLQQPEEVNRYLKVLDEFGRQPPRMRSLLELEISEHVRRYADFVRRQIFRSD